MSGTVLAILQTVIGGLILAGFAGILNLKNEVTKLTEKVNNCERRLESTDGVSEKILNRIEEHFGNHIRGADLEYLKERIKEIADSLK